MNAFLKLKHWQIFAMTFGLAMAFEFIIIGSMIASGSASVIFWAFPLMMILYTGVLFSWFYAMGTNLHRRLPESVTMSLPRFKTFMAIAYGYMVCISFFILSVRFMADYFRSGDGPIFLIVAIVLPLHLFSMFCIFYTMWFIAKALKSVELQRPVSFSDFAGEFFMLWFFPVGVWFIQPRINKMFNPID